MARATVVGWYMAASPRSASPQHAAAPWLLAGLLLTGPLLAAPGPAYFECRYRDDPAEPGDGGPIRLMVDRAARRLVWVEPGEDGWLRRTFFEIVAITPQDVVARGRRDGDEAHLTLNTVSGDWSLELPVARSRNTSTWNPGDQRLGYAENLQLYANIEGACVRAE